MMTEVSPALDGLIPGRQRVDTERTAKLLFIVPAVVYLFCLSIIPFVYSVYLSLFQAKLTRLDRKFYVGLENYQDLLTDPTFLKSIQNTAVLTVSSVG
ncbi:MAG: sugar ABC transporter permease, partial [bacterium]|nr:sugar ABC transporter permease [bacterium]